MAKLKKSHLMGVGLLFAASLLAANWSLLSEVKIGVVRYAKRDGPRLTTAAATTTQSEGAARGGARSTMTTQMVKEELKDAFGHPLPESPHKEWRNQYENPYQAERKVPCKVREATETNLKGFALAKGVSMKDLRTTSTEEKRVEALKSAAGIFEEATKQDPQCGTAFLNGAIVLFALGNFQQAHTAANSAAKLNGFDPSVTNKAKLWVCIVEEQLRGDIERIKRQCYAPVIKSTPTFSLPYFGLKPEHVEHMDSGKFPMYAITKDEMHGPRSDVITRKAMQKLLLVREYASFYGGYPAITRAEAQTWHTRQWIFIRNMLPPLVLEATQEWYREAILQGVVDREDSSPQYQAVRFRSYNDPIARFSLYNFNEMISRLAERATKPSYTYFGGYLNQAILHPHRDRLQCQFTLSVNVDINPVGEQCPLEFGMKANPTPPDYPGGRMRFPPAEEKGIAFHRPGDAVLINGRAVTHWRGKMPPGFNCSQVFFHYVFEDFPLTLR